MIYRLRTTATQLYSIISSLLKSYYFPGSGGYLGEVTMVQLYEVALSAGKAHKDHKHHHAHHYEHDTENNTPRPTRPPVTGPPLPQHPYLTAGQINHQVRNIDTRNASPSPASRMEQRYANLVEFQIKLNPGTPLQIIQDGVTLRHPSLIPRHPPPQPLPPANPNSVSTAFPLQSTHFFGNLQSTVGLPSASGITNTADSSPYRNLFKREENSLGVESEEEKSYSSFEETVIQVGKSTIEKRGIEKNGVSEGKFSDGKVRNTM